MTDLNNEKIVMKKLLAITAVATAIAISLSSCFREEKMGFPNKVEFGAEGGTQLFQGTDWVYVSGFTPDRVVTPDNPATIDTLTDIETVTNGWLTVITNPNATVTFVARPNDTPSPRHMTVEVTSAYKYHDIKIWQAAGK